METLEQVHLQHIFATKPNSNAEAFLDLEALGIPLPIMGCSTFGAMAPVIIAIAVLVLVWAIFKGGHDLPSARPEILCKL